MNRSQMNRSTLLLFFSMLTGFIWDACDYYEFVNAVEVEIKWIFVLLLVIQFLFSFEKLKNYVFDWVIVSISAYQFA